MILYEVTATPEPQLRNAFETYMREKHIGEVLATGCFVAARIAVAASGQYRTTYVASQQSDLDRYLQDHAHHLRADFAAHFPSGVSLAREVWSVLEEMQA